MILALAAVTCWLALASPAAAQSMLGGVVYDPTGQVAANVTVVAENERSGETWETRTSPLGIYAFYNLPNGIYTIRVSLSPLSFRKTGVKVRTGTKAALDIELRIGREEHITVRSASLLPRPLPDGSVGVVYSREAIDAMFKTNGDTLQSVLTARPGINFTESVGTLAQFTAVGQRRFSNRLTIDGVSGDLAIDVGALGLSQAGSATLPAFATSGGTQTLIPMSAVEEIEVRTTNASSDLARSAGAQTVVLTRSGTDKFTAISKAQVRPDALAASNWFVNAGKRPHARNRYWDGSVSLGGPLLPKRLFYFGTWERQQADRSVFTTVNVPSQALREGMARRHAGSLLASIIGAFPLPNGREFPGGSAELTARFPAISHSNTISVRLDAPLSNALRPFVRFNRGTSAGDSLTRSFVPVYTFTNTESTETETTTIGVSSAWRNVTNDIRASVASHRGSVVASPARLPGAEALPYDRLIAPTVRQKDVWISILLPFDSGVLNSGPFIGNAQEQLQLVDTLSFALGRHEWRAGFEYQRVTASMEPAPHRYTYRFGENIEFTDGTAQFVTLSTSTPARARREAWAVFVTDTFRASPRLTFNFGLRYSVKPAPFGRTEVTPYLIDFNSLEPNVVPKPRNGSLWDTSWSDIAPRVAATYQVGTKTNWETNIRSGASLIFDDRSNSGMGAFGAGYGYTFSRSIPNSPFPVPADNLLVFPIAPFSTDDRSTYYSFPTDLRTPRMYEWNFGIDQSLGRSQQLSVAYVGSAGRDLIYWHTYDVGQQFVNAYSNDARADYNALIVEYVRRRAHGAQGSVVYTWSHALDNDSGEASRGYAPPSLISPSLSWGSADFDRRHILRMVGSYQVPNFRSPNWLLRVCEDWQIDTVLTAQSGTPVSVIYVKNFTFGTYFARPDAVNGVPTWVVDSSSPGGRHLNSNAFAVSTAARQGGLGRNTLRAFPLRQVDASLSRPIRVGTRLVVHLRFDVFNVFNTPNFGPPNGLFRANDFGVPDRSFAESLGTGTLQNGGLLPIQQIGGSRSLQVGVRLSY